MNPNFQKYKCSIIALMTITMFSNCSVKKQLITKKEIKAFIILNPTINLGYVTEGEIKTFEVILKNPGNVPIKIHSAQANCGCIVPSIDTSPIAPNEESIILLKYYSKSKGSKEGKENNYEFRVGTDADGNGLVKISAMVYSK